MPTRRQFLQAGLAGGAILAGAGWWVLRGDRRPASGLRWLDKRSAALVEALIPAVLAGALPAGPEGQGKAVREVLEAFDRAMAGLAPAVQEEIRQLMALLALPPARYLLAGVRSPWPEASPDEAAGFLRRWQESRFPLLRSASQALCQLILAAWYGNTASWAAIGYGGPPALG